jgi:hypothetical protein
MQGREVPMTRDELDDYVWSQLSVRKHAAGRRVVSRIVADAVRDFPGYSMARCDRGEAEVLGKVWARSFARRRHNEYGTGIILTLVLSALISEIVKTLIRWWLESRENRMAMQALRETP